MPKPGKIQKCPGRSSSFLDLQEGEEEKRNIFAKWVLNVFVGVDGGQKQGQGTGRRHIRSFQDSNPVNVSHQS